jgi:predicted ATPase
VSRQAPSFKRAERVEDASPALPGFFDAFLGREGDLLRLTRALGAGAGVTTLVGPAGIGKTRLACAVAAGLIQSGELEGGVYLAELGGQRSPDEALATVIAAFPWKGRREPVDADMLADRCAARGAFLMVLDDVERQLDFTKRIIETVRRRAPEARFLVTSREPLGLRGEKVLPLDALATRDAVDLFRARAASARTRPEDLFDDEALERLVTRLDGNPLAIELAAARAEVLSPRAMLDRLDDRFTLLARPGDHTGRHASLRAAIGLSWELLGPRERVALARFSVFAGPFDLSAAEAVLEEPGSALEIVHTLVRKSLLRADADRFVALESVRVFAAEMLDEPAHVRRLKAQHFLDGSRRMGARPSESARGALLRALPDWLDALEGASNMGAESAAELGVRMEAALYGRIPLDLHRAIVDHTLRAAREATSGPEGDLQDHGILLARAHVAEARVLRVGGDNPGAMRALEHARRAAPPGHPVSVEVLRLMGQAERHRGRLQEARRLLGEALAATDEAGLDELRGPILDDLGVVCLDTGELAQAEQHALDALAHHRRTGDRRYEGISIGHLGIVAHARGELDEAERRYTHALAIAREIGDARFDDFTRAFLAMVALEQGEAARARAGLARADGDECNREPADPRAHALIACVEAVLAASAGRPADAAEILADARTRLGADCDGERGAIALVARWLADLHDNSVVIDSHLGSSEAAPRCIEERLAARLVEAMRARSAPAPRVLDVGPDGRWFSLQGRARVSLARRRSLQRLFAYLVRMREGRPGVGASWQELLAAGWPGEKVVPSAGQRRAYVAVATLRTLGLAEVLLHTDDGYLVDPAVVLRRTEEPQL